MIKWVQKQFKRPKFQRKQFNKILDKQEKIRQDAERIFKHASKRCHQGSIRLVGQGMYYPEMEAALAANIIRTLRERGIPVESWMVNFEARSIFRRLHPDKYPSEDEIELNGDDGVDYPLKCSNK